MWHNLAAVTSKNELVLLSNALQTKTALSQPELLQMPENASNSLWGLRRKLLQQGWSAGAGGIASASGKIFNSRNSFKQYFRLLLERPSPCQCLRSRFARDVLKDMLMWPLQCCCKERKTWRAMKRRTPSPTQFFVVGPTTAFERAWRDLERRPFRAKEKLFASACLATSGQVVQVPKNKLAKGYHQLQAFLKGEALLASCRVRM